MKEKSKHHKIKIKLDKEEVVDEMVKEWDIVKCHYCGKRISMLNAKLVDDKYFVCREH